MGMSGRLTETASDSQLQPGWCHPVCPDLPGPFQGSGRAGGPRVLTGQVYQSSDLAQVGSEFGLRVQGIEFGCDVVGCQLTNSWHEMEQQLDDHQHNETP